MKKKQNNKTIKKTTITPPKNKTFFEKACDFVKSNFAVTIAFFIVIKNKIVSLFAKKGE